MSKEMKRWPISVVPAIGILVLLVISGCGSNDDGSGESADGNTGGANLEAAQAQLDKFSGIPKFEAPGPPVDAAQVRGMSVFSIPDSTANPFAQTILDGEAEAAKALGIDFRECQAKGQVADWVRCYGEATSRDTDLILSCCGVDPRVVGPQIREAQDQGIPVLAPHVYGFSQDPVAVDYSIPAPYEQAGRIVADWIISDTEADADVLVITSDEVTGTPPIVSGIKDEFDKNCGGGCDLTFVNVPVADWSTKIQTEVQSALVRDPNINYILPLYDSMSQFVVPAVRAAQKVGDVQVATYNGTPFVLKYIQDDDIVTMDVGESENWMGWAYMDAAVRVLAGEDIPRTFRENTPLRVFTDDNVDEAGVPPKVNEGYGDAYIDGYKDLWGIK